MQSEHTLRMVETPVPTPEPQVACSCGAVSGPMESIAEATAWEHSHRGSAVVPDVDERPPAL